MPNLYNKLQQIQGEKNEKWVSEKIKVYARYYLGLLVRFGEKDFLLLWNKFVKLYCFEFAPKVWCKMQKTGENVVQL